MNQIIIDVREPNEYSRGHVTGALNLPPAALMAGAKLLESVPKDTRLVLYCHSGARSNAAAHYLRRMGFTDVVNGINQLHVEKNYL